jgi:hypothetical protein
MLVLFLWAQMGFQLIFKSKDLHASKYISALGSRRNEWLVITRT